MGDTNLILFFTASLVVSPIAYFSGTLGGRLRRRPRFARGLNWLTGAYC